MKIRKLFRIRFMGLPWHNSASEMFVNLNICYMVQNKVDKFSIDIHSKFDITLNHLM